MDGTTDPRTGVDGKPYGIGFVIALPGNCNGGFLFQGGGGLNGSCSTGRPGSDAGNAVLPHLFRRRRSILPCRQRTIRLEGRLRYSGTPGDVASGVEETTLRPTDARLKW